MLARPAHKHHRARTSALFALVGLIALLSLYSTWASFSLTTIITTTLHRNDQVVEDVSALHHPAQFTTKESAAWNEDDDRGSISRNNILVFSLSSAVSAQSSVKKTSMPPWSRPSRLADLIAFILRRSVLPHGITAAFCKKQRQVKEATNEETTHEGSSAANSNNVNSVGAAIEQTMVETCRSITQKLLLPAVNSERRRLPLWLSHALGFDLVVEESIANKGNNEKQPRTFLQRAKETNAFKTAVITIKQLLHRKQQRYHSCNENAHLNTDDGAGDVGITRGGVVVRVPFECVDLAPLWLELLSISQQPHQQSRTAHPNDHHLSTAEASAASHFKHSPSCVILWDGVGHEAAAAKTTMAAAGRISMTEWGDITTTWLSKVIASCELFRIDDTTPTQFNEQRIHTRAVVLSPSSLLADHSSNMNSGEQENSSGITLNVTVVNAMMRNLSLSRLSASARMFAQQHLEIIMRGRQSAGAINAHQLYHDVMVAPRVLQSQHTRTLQKRHDDGISDASETNIDDEEEEEPNKRTRGKKRRSRETLIGPRMPMAIRKFVRDSVASGLLMRGSLSSLNWPVFTHDKHNAYVSIITSNNRDYAHGAVALGYSLDLVDATRDRILIVTAQVNANIRSILSSLGGWTIHESVALQEPWFDNPNKCKWKPKRGMNQSVRWGRMSTKLLLWDLDQYTRVLYMDADVLVTGNINAFFDDQHLIDRLDDAGVELVGEGGTGHKFVNAGMLLVKPSKAVLKAMLVYAEDNDPPGFFPNLVDCTEQGLINAFFGRPVQLGDLVNMQKQQRFNHANFDGEDEDTDCGDGGGGLHSVMLPPNTRALALQVQASGRWAVGRPDVTRDYRTCASLAVHFVRQDRCAKPWSFFKGSGNHIPTDAFRVSASVSSSSSSPDATFASLGCCVLTPKCNRTPYSLYLSLVFAHGLEPTFTAV